MRVLVLIAALALAAALSTGASGGTGLQDGVRAGATEYVVLYANGASLAEARLAVRAVGGTIVNENVDVGLTTVSSVNPTFLTDVASQSALAGAARSTPLGRAERPNRARKDDERLESERRASKGQGGKKKGGRPPEPLANLQWDMAMIHATSDGSYRRQAGDRQVLVGIIDTGIDGSHPDIAPNFDRRESRNFTTDIPSVDGPCQDEPDQSCSDPADVDENGHGTHVAGTVGAALNGLGIAGVAPKVKLVNLRAGQDSGYFFLQPTVDAITYAARIGVDVVNMSFFTDPWLYNCQANPADSPEEQLEQRTIVAAVNRAARFAHARDVTLIAAEGNENSDLGKPAVDGISPDFPPGSEKVRTIDPDQCDVVPTEANHVLSISAVGPSTIKADYSNYGLKETTVAAPGGYFRDLFGTPEYRTPGNLVLSAYPESLAVANGEVNPDGTPNTPFVVRDCNGGTCAYYQYLQGTSMASPHAVGVAALVVSEFGRQSRGDKSLDPDRTERILRRSATDHACPDPPLIDYTIVGRPPDYNALCEGTSGFNSIWGDGIVDALAAVR